MLGLDAKWRHAIRLIVCSAALGVVIGCQTTPEDSDWLYHQLGEYQGISELTETLVLNLAQDRRISSIFKNTDINRFHRLLTEQFCVLSGGPCTYTGRDMVEAHRGLHLTSADFNALVEDLIRAMETKHIPTAAQNRLLAQLAPMRPDVVGKHRLQPPPPDANTFGLRDLELSDYPAARR